MNVKSLSCVQLLATPWTAAYQDPPSMGFSRQEYWSGVLSPSPSCLCPVLHIWDQCFLVAKQPDFGFGSPSLESRRKPWHPTPLLLPGKSHGWRAWWAVVQGVAKSQTRLSDFTFTFHFHTLEKEMATHSSVLAWRIPEMGEPRGRQSMGSHRVRHDWSDLAAALNPASAMYWLCGFGQVTFSEPVFLTFKNNTSYYVSHCIIYRGASQVTQQ